MPIAPLVFPGPSADALAHLAPQRVRHPLRFRVLTVAAVQPLSPHMVRVTLSGSDLEGFVSVGFDDHVKLFFPDPQTGALTVPSLGADGPEWPDGVRPVMRDYTPRAFDAVAQTLTIDFALHAPAGPATQWAQQARLGQQLGVGGPKGSMVVPQGFDWHLLVGDDTALPAMARRLEELPKGARAHVLVEVNSPADELALPSAAHVHVQWVHRHGADSQAYPLLDALRQITMPSGTFYSWVACEAAQSSAIREYLVTECRTNPQWVKASAYWRRSGSEA